MKTIALEPKSYILNWMAPRVGGHPGEQASAIGLFDSERDDLCAGVFYHDWSGPNIVMSVAGEGTRWMTKEFLWFAFYYPFVQLDCERITGLIESWNVASLGLAKNLGFEEEARLRRAARGGYDMIVHVLWRDKCKWHRLKEKDHGKSKYSTGPELLGSGQRPGGREQHGGSRPERDQPPERLYA